MHDQAADTTVFSIDPSGNTTIGLAAAIGNKLHVDGDIGFANATIFVSGTGIYRALDGSAAAPYYTFTGDTDTGMYRVDNDVLGFAIDGTQIMKMGDDLDAGVQVPAVFKANRASVQTITGATATLDDSDDAGQVIDCNRGTAQTITLPSAPDVGTTFLIVARGAGVVSIARGGSDTINGGTANVSIQNQYGAATLILVAANTWTAIGDL